MKMNKSGTNTLLTITKLILWGTGGFIVGLLLLALVDLGTDKEPWEDDRGFLQVFTTATAEYQTDYLIVTERGKGYANSSQYTEAYHISMDIVDASIDLCDEIIRFEEKYKEYLTSEQQQYIDDWKATTEHMSDGWAYYKTSVDENTSAYDSNVYYGISESYESYAKVRTFQESVMSEYE